MCPVEMAIRCDTICHLTNVAAQTGRVINWDPAKEEIVADSEASSMLTRPYREQWKVWQVRSTSPLPLGEGTNLQKSIYYKERASYEIE